MNTGTFLLIVASIKAALRNLRCVHNSYLRSYSLFSESCPFYGMREVDNKGGSVCLQGGLRYQGYSLGDIMDTNL
jgi:hypothetical protein